MRGDSGCSSSLSLAESDVVGDKLLKCLQTAGQGVDPVVRLLQFFLHVTLVPAHDAYLGGARKKRRGEGAAARLAPGVGRHFEIIG